MYKIDVFQKIIQVLAHRVSQPVCLHSSTMPDAGFAEPLLKFLLRQNAGSRKTCWDCIALNQGSSCHLWWDKGRFWLHKREQRPLNHTLSLLVPSHFELQAFLRSTMPFRKIWNPNRPTVYMHSTIRTSCISFLVNFGWLLDMSAWIAIMPDVLTSSTGSITFI